MSELRLNTVTDKDTDKGVNVDALHYQNQQLIRNLGEYRAGLTYSQKGDYATFNDQAIITNDDTPLPYTTQGADPTDGPDEGLVIPFAEVTRSDVVLNVASISELLSVQPTGEGFKVNVTAYHGGFDATSDLPKGGGVFVWSTGRHNGGTFIDPARSFPSDWGDQSQLEAWFADSGSDVSGWARQYSGAVNVNWFGAEGDGSTNDTLALQSTFTFATSSYMPSGVYPVSRPLRIDKEGFSLFGENVQNTKILKSGNETTGLPVFDFSGSSIELDVDTVLIVEPGKTAGANSTFTYNVNMSNIRFSNASKATTTYALYAPLVAFFNADNVLGYAKTFGFYSNNIWMSKLERLTMSADNPFVVRGGTSLFLSRCWALGAASDDTVYAYNFRNLMYSTMMNCGGDFLGSEDLPATAWIYTIYSNLSVINCACEKSHLQRLFRIQQSDVVIDNFKSFKNENRFGDPGGWGQWITAEGKSKLRISNSELRGKYSQNNPTYGSKVPNALHIVSSICEYSYNKDNARDMSEYAVSGSGYIKYESKNYSEDIGSLAVENKHGVDNPTAVSNKDIVLPRRNAEGDTRVISFKSKDTRQGYIKATLGSYLDGSPTTIVIGANSGTYSPVDVATFSPSGVRPGSDNTTSLGSADSRWSVIYAGTGTINTSDDREKTYLTIDETELLVAKELKSLVRKFKFNDAIEEKGIDKARIHYGTSAQEVITVFEKHGLNAADYAMVCYDEWEEVPEVKDKEGNITQEYMPAGDRYGIRYEELIMFILGATDTN